MQGAAPLPDAEGVCFLGSLTSVAIPLPRCYPLWLGDMNWEELGQPGSLSRC
jgi:hypothetical protein